MESDRVNRRRVNYDSLVNDNISASQSSRFSQSSQSSRSVQSSQSIRVEKKDRMLTINPEIQALTTPISELSGESVYIDEVETTPSDFVISLSYNNYISEESVLPEDVKVSNIYGPIQNYDEIILAAGNNDGVNSILTNDLILVSVDDIRSSRIIPIFRIKFHSGNTFSLLSDNGYYLAYNNGRLQFQEHEYILTPSLSSVDNQPITRLLAGAFYSLTSRSSEIVNIYLPDNQSTNLVMFLPIHPVQNIKRLLKLAKQRELKFFTTPEWDNLLNQRLINGEKIYCSEETDEHNCGSCLGYCPINSACYPTEDGYHCVENRSQQDTDTIKYSKDLTRNPSHHLSKNPSRNITPSSKRNSAQNSEPNSTQNSNPNVTPNSTQEATSDVYVPPGISSVFTIFGIILGLAVFALIIWYFAGRAGWYI